MRRICALVMLCLVAFLAPFVASAQVFPREVPAGHTPRGALVRAAVPGWGQAYNRQYLKMPVVYAALGGLGYAAVSLYGKHRDYRCAFQWRGFEDLVESGTVVTNPRPECEADYRAIAAAVGREDLPASTLRTQRDALRRNRDLTILLIGAVYALQALDAYVSAHLLDFDVSEDLSLRVAPGVGGPSGMFGAREYGAWEGFAGKPTLGASVPISVRLRVTF